MSDDPLRPLAKAICAPSADQAGSIWKNGRSRRSASPSASVSRRSPSTVGRHHEDRVVAVAAADERDVRRCRRRHHRSLRQAGRRWRRERCRGHSPTHGHASLIISAATEYGRARGILRVRDSRERISNLRTKAQTSARAARRRGTGAGGRDRPRERVAVVSAAMRPPIMTSWRSASAVATPRFCSMRRIAQPLLLEVLEGLDQPLDDRRSETFGRLVHHEDPRIRHERATDREHLLLTARELRAAVPLALGEAREQLVDTLARPLAPRSTTRRAMRSAGAGRRSATETAGGPAARSRSRAERSCARERRRAPRRRRGSSLPRAAARSP